MSLNYLKKGMTLFTKVTWLTPYNFPDECHSVTGNAVIGFSHFVSHSRDCEYTSPACCEMVVLSQSACLSVV